MAPENRAARAMARTQFLALGLRYHSSDGRTEPRSESSQVVLVDELLPLMSHLRGAKSTALLGGPVGCTASALPVRIRMEQERSSQAVAISDKHPYHSSHVIVRRQRSQIVATGLSCNGSACTPQFGFGHRCWHVSAQSGSLYIAGRVNCRAAKLWEGSVHPMRRSGELQRTYPFETQTQRRSNYRSTQVGRPKTTTFQLLHISLAGLRPKT